MNQSSNEKYITFVLTLASAGMIIENIVMGWEFWMVPVVFAGVVLIWGISLTRD